MEIKISKISDGRYMADLSDLTGVPPIGRGATPEDAVVDLFYSILHPDQLPEWTIDIDFNFYTIIKEGF